jgi:hypothetical protein
LILVLAFPFSAKSNPLGRSKIYAYYIISDFYACSVTNQSQFSHSDVGTKNEEKATTILKKSTTSNFNEGTVALQLHAD